MFDDGDSVGPADDGDDVLADLIGGGCAIGCRLVLIAIGLFFCFAYVKDEQHPFGKYPEIRAFARSIPLVSVFLFPTPEELARDAAAASAGD
jgi:hypothetical protein